MKPQSRQTLAYAQSKAAPLRIILLTLPLWACSLLLIFFMPLTGFISFIVVVCCLFILPFQARHAYCPGCGQGKTFAFSGLGFICKGCGDELVLRGKSVHLLEAKSKQAKAGTGRGNQALRR